MAAAAVAGGPDGVNVRLAAGPTLTATFARDGAGATLALDGTTRALAATVQAIAA